MPNASDSFAAPERLALDSYREGELSRGQVSELLELSLWETEAFLKENGCGLGLGFEDYERSTTKLREFLAQ